MRGRVDQTAIQRFQSGLEDAVKALGKVMDDQAKQTDETMKVMAETSGRVIEALRAPRELIRDANGRPAGMRVAFDAESSRNRDENASKSDDILQNPTRDLPGTTSENDGIEQ